MDLPALEFRLASSPQEHRDCRGQEGGRLFCYWNGSILHYVTISACFNTKLWGEKKNPLRVSVNIQICSLVSTEYKMSLQFTTKNSIKKYIIFFLSYLNVPFTVISYLLLQYIYFNATPETCIWIAYYQWDGLRVKGHTVISMYEYPGFFGGRLFGLFLPLLIGYSSLRGKGERDRGMTCSKGR